MSDNSCLENVTNTDIDNVFSMLQKQYEKNHEATLNPDQLLLINKVAEDLEKNLLSRGIILNKSNFINLIKKLCPSSDMLYGGADDEIIEYYNPPGNTSNMTTVKNIMLDLTAILSLVVSIILLYSFSKYL